jgi:hypothetical protein
MLSGITIFGNDITVFFISTTDYLRGLCNLRVKCMRAQVDETKVCRVEARLLLSGVSGEYYVVS